MNRAEKFFLRGKASKDLEHYAAAIEDFSKAIELDPTHEDVCDFYFERGECLAHLKKLPAAIEDFDKAIEFAPSYIKDYIDRGKCFEQLEDIAASEKIFNKPTDNEPIDDATDNLTDEQLIYAWQNFAVPTLGHGKCSFDLGEFEVALKDFDAVIAAVPNAKNLFYIKYSGWDLRTFDEFNFNRVLVVLAYVGRGQCFQQLGNVQRAQADFDTIKDLGGKFLDFAGR